MDEVFSNVIEQKLFNQPVEVRVRSGGLGFLLGKIPGGLEPFLSFLSPEGILAHCPLIAHCRLRKLYR